MSDAAITSEAPRTAEVRMRFLKTDTGHPSTGRCQGGTRARLQWRKRPLRGSVGARPEHLTCWTSCSRGGAGAICVFWTRPPVHERHVVTPTDGAYSSWSYEAPDDLVFTPP